MCAAIIGACSKEAPNTNDEDNSQPETSEYYEVGFSSKLIGMSVSPMSKASSSDMYGLEIYIVDDLYNSPEHEIYACWVTDNLSGEKIRLMKGHKYLCCLVYVPDGQNVLEPGGSPFLSMAYANTPSPKIGDGVKYGKYDIGMAANGWTQKAGHYYVGPANTWNDVDIYYGFQVISSDESADVSIDLYRMMFGLNVAVTNLQSGKILVYNDYAEGYEDYAYIYELTPSQPSFDHVLELSGFPFGDNLIAVISADSDGQHWGIGCSPDDLANSSAVDRMHIVYDDGNGNRYKLYNEEVTFKRLTKYSFTFDLLEVMSEYQASITANIKDESWSTATIK